MERLRFEDYELEHDPERTRAAWRSVRRGAARDCGCRICRAFDGRRTELLSARLLELLTRLGLDPKLESELAVIGGGTQHELRLRVGWAFSGRVQQRPSTTEASFPLRVNEQPGRAPQGLLEGPLAALELEFCMELPSAAAPRG